MASVCGRDLRAIERFLELAYDLSGEVAVQGGHPPGTHAPGALPRSVLQALKGLISADLVESFQMRRGYVIGLPFTTDRDEDEPPPEFQIYAPLRGENPIGAFKWSPADGPIRLSAVMSARQLKQLPWHRYYLRPLRIQDQLKVWLWSSGDQRACVSLDRADGYFDDRDVAVLAVLQQHLAAMRESFMTTENDHREPSTDALTVREAQVLSWAARGRRNEEIAQLLFIAPATVRKHLEHAYLKLGVRNRVEAIAAIRTRDSAPG